MQKLNIDQETIFRRSSVFKESVSSVNSKDIENLQMHINQCCVYVAWMTRFHRNYRARSFRRSPRSPARQTCSGWSSRPSSRLWVELKAVNRQRAKQLGTRGNALAERARASRYASAFAACLARVINCEACAWDWWGCSFCFGMLPRPAASTLYSGHSKSATIDYF